MYAGAGARRNGDCDYSVYWTAQGSLPKTKVEESDIPPGNPSGLQGHLMGTLSFP